MRGYTKIPNDLLTSSQLSIPARYLHCVLLRYSGKSDWCFPSQETLAKDLNHSDRYVRSLLKELEKEGLIKRSRRGFNRSNTYKVAKSLTSNRNTNSVLDIPPSSSQIGSAIPLHEGSSIPPNSTYLKGKDNNTFSHKGLEKLRQDLIKKGIIKDKAIKILPTNGERR